MGLPARGRLSRFFADLGWRAYAIPLLIIATTLVLVDFTRSDAGSGGSTPTGSSQPASQTEPTIIADVPDAPKPTGSAAASGTPKPQPNLPSYALPAGKSYTAKGTGEFDVVPGVSQEYGTGGPLKTFTVEVETGIQGVDPAAFATEVEKILGDPRGWGHGGKMKFQRVDSGNADFRVSLTTPETVRRPDFCGYSIEAETSCNNRNIDRVVINLARWTRGAVGYGNGRDLEAYRQYAITHEVGHALGHGHQACPKAGALAPPMLQQTLGLTSANNLTCKPNPWPFPTGDTEITGPDTTAAPKMN